LEPRDRPRRRSILGRSPTTGHVACTRCCRALGRHTAFLIVDRRVAHAATSAAHGAQRTRDQLAPRSLASTRTPNPRGVEAFAALDRLSLRPFDRRATSERAMQLALARQRPGRDSNRGTRPALATFVALAGAMSSISLPPRTVAASTSRLCLGDLDSIL